MKISSQKTSVSSAVSIRPLLIIAALIVTTLAARAGNTIWSGANGDHNWSTTGNWTSGGGSTPPAAGDTVIFGAGGNQGAAGTIDNIVDGGFTVAPGGLILSNETANNFHTTQIPGGTALAIAGPIVVGTNLNTATYTFTGGGTLQGGTGTSVFTIATLGGGTLTLDLSSLSNFVWNAGGTGANFNLGLDPGTSSGGILKLAAVSNNITATTMIVADNNSSGSSTLSLGAGTNILNVNTLEVAWDKVTGTINFNSASGGLRLRNAAGTGRATVTVCDNAHSGSASATTTGNISLKGHYVDMQIGTLTLANRHSRTGGSDNAFFSFDMGIVDVTTLNMAVNGTNGTAPIGTMSVGGGTLNVGTISLANCAGTTGTGTLQITNTGVVVCTNGISKGTNSIGNISMNGGSLILASGNATIGAAANGLDNLNLTNATLQFSIPIGATPLAYVTNLNLGAGTNFIGISTLNPTILIYPTVFPLIKYAALHGTFSLTNGALPLGFTGVISNDVANSQIDLVITGGPALPRDIFWRGLNGSALTSAWDINITPDWLSNATAVFYNDNGGQGGDIVNFTDSGATNLVTLAANVSPTTINVTNNVLNYAINDNNNNYSINGNGILNKQGSQTLILDNSGGVNLVGGVTIGGGTLQIGNNDSGGGLGSGAVVDNGALVFSRTNNSLTVANVISGAGSIAINDTSGTLTLSGANSFSGAVTVASGGTLKLGNNSALGTTNIGTTIANGAALDLAARTIGQEPVTVQGIGVLNNDGSTNGALYSSGGSITLAVQRVTLTGDTVFGAPPNQSALSNRWDIRSSTTSDATGASLSTGGHAYSITKVGNNQISIVGVTVDPNLADIDVQQGLLSMEVATTGLGDPSRTLTVESGATFQVYQITNQLNKIIVMQNNSTLNDGSGNDTIIGPMILTNGNVNINGTGTTILTLSNSISGVGSLTKNNTNTLVLAGTNSYGGGTTINDGTLILNCISGNPTNVLTENVSQSGASVPAVFGGNGTNVGPVDIEDILHPGAGGHPGTLGIGSGPGNEYPGNDGALMFGAQGGGALSAIFDLNSVTNAGGGINDLVVVNGDLDGNFAHVKINPLGILSTNGVYTLVTYSGVKNNNFGSPQTVTPSRYQFTLNYPAHAVTLSVSGGPALLQWNNAAGNGVWDVQASQNWFNTSSSANDVFYDFDAVMLDDTITNSAAPGTSINLGTVVTPQMVTNNSTVNYTLFGAGKITGSAGLYKSGTSKLTLLNSNDFSGPVVVSGGTLAISNNTSAGSTASTVFVTNSATLDISPSTTNNGLNFGTKLFVVSGPGVNGNGAIFNSGTNQQNAFQNVTLTGDTIFGGSARWDIRSPVNTSAGATLSTGGNGYKLTKVGTNFIALSSVAIDPALGDIDVSNGTLSVETQITSLGNPANKVTVFNGATLELWNLTNIISKPVTLQAGATLINGSGSNIYNGAFTVQGDSTMNVGSLGLVLNGAIGLTGNLTVTNSSPLILNGLVSGAGGITKTGAGTLTLNANNSYSGGTLINTGTMALGASGSISASTNIVIASGATLTDGNNSGISGCPNILDNGELDVSGLTAATLTLNSGQTLGGSGHVTGRLIANEGSILSPGIKAIVGTSLIVSSTVILKGTNYMEIASGTSYDKLACGGVTYGGTLIISNVSVTPFTTNNSFQLFSAGTYGGAFTNIVPANPNNDLSLAWDTNNLSVNGTLKIKAVVTGPPPTPHITGVSLNGATLHVTATNGASGGQFLLLSSTNVALPLSQWQTNVIGSFDGSGNLNLSTNIINAGDEQRFYILKQ